MSSVPWSVTSRKVAPSAGVALLRRMKEVEPVRKGTTIFTTPARKSDVPQSCK